MHQRREVRGHQLKAAQDPELLRRLARQGVPVVAELPQAPLVVGVGVEGIFHRARRARNEEERLSQDPQIKPLDEGLQLHRRRFAGAWRDAPGMLGQKLQSAQGERGGREHHLSHMRRRPAGKGLRQPRHELGGNRRLLRKAHVAAVNEAVAAGIAFHLASSEVLRHGVVS